MNVPACGRPPRMLLVAVDDDQARSLSRGLVDVGMRVRVARTREDLAVAAAGFKADVLVAESEALGSFPRRVIARVRAADPWLSVLLIVRSPLATDRIRGLDAGGDVCLSLPVQVVEVAAHIRALVRRAQMSGILRGEVLEAAGLVVDVDAREVYRDDLPIALSDTEFRLLACLMRSPEHPVSREQIADEVWGGRVPAGSNLLDLYISYLRSKLAVRGSPVILTVRAHGFVMARPAP